VLEFGARRKRPQLFKFILHELNGSKFEDEFQLDSQMPESLAMEWRAASRTPAPFPARPESPGFREGVLRNRQVPDSCDSSQGRSNSAPKSKIGR